MSANVGRFDRVARAAAAAALLLGSLAAPLPLAARLGLGAVGLYAAITVIVGRCVGYSLLGLSTCPTSGAPARRDR